MRCARIGEKAQRLAVHPLAVVHEEQQRPLVGEVHDEPEEAVQRLEAGVALDRGPLVDLEQARGGRRRAREQSVLGGVDGGLEQLAHDAERELLLEL